MNDWRDDIEQAVAAFLTARQRAFLPGWRSTAFRGDGA